MSSLNFKSRLGLSPSVIKKAGDLPPVAMAFPADGAKFHLDFAGSQFFGGVQPDDTANSNDGRFFRQQVSPALPMYAENVDGSLKRMATGTPLRRSNRGLLVEPQVEYTTRCLQSNNLSAAGWVADGIAVTYNQASRTGIANSASRLTSSKNGATILYAATYAQATLNMGIDIRSVSGSGVVELTLDGVTWTPVTLNKPRFNGIGRYMLPLQSVTNPVYGIRMASGDVIDVSFITSDTFEWEMSPFDTSGTVRRRTYDRPSTSLQGGTTTSVSSGLMDWLATATEWGVYMEWDSLKPDHFLFGQILRPFADGSMRFSTDDTDNKGVYSATGLVRKTLDRGNPLKNKALGWTKDGKCYLSVNGSDPVVSSHSAGGPYTALDHKDLGSNGAGAVNMVGYIQQLIMFEKTPSAAQAKLWTTL